MRRVHTPLGDVRQLGAMFLVFGAYFVGAKLGLKLAFFHPSATPVWPSTGIALASLLLIGYRAWPGIFLGAFLANLTTKGTVWTSLGIATGNTLEGLIGAYLIGAYANGSHAFNRAQDIFKFAVLGGMSATVSATIGVTSLALGGFAAWADYRPIWFTWWLGDAAGALIFAPLLILWAQAPPPRWQGRAMLERGVFLAALLPISWIVFGGVFAFAYLTVPFLVWAAFRFDQRETATVIVILSVVAIWGTVEGLGPFVGATPNESLLLLQSFMGLMVLVAMPLASVVKDNALRIANEQRARQEAELAAERVARVQAVTAALSGAVTQAQMVDVILGQGTLALGARAGWVSVLSDDGDSLQLVGHAGGYPEEFVRELRRVSLSEPRPMTRVVKTGAPLFFDSDASMRSHFPESRVFYEDGARAVLPLSSAGKPIGVLVLNFSRSRVFDTHEQSLMVTLAQQCAQGVGTRAVLRARALRREDAPAGVLAGNAARSPRPPDRRRLRARGGGVGHRRGLVRCVSALGWPDRRYGRGCRWIGRARGRDDGADTPIDPGDGSGGAQPDRRVGPSQQGPPGDVRTRRHGDGGVWHSRSPVPDIHVCNRRTSATGAGDARWGDPGAGIGSRSVGCQRRGALSRPDRAPAARRTAGALHRWLDRVHSQHGGGRSVAARCHAGRTASWFRASGACPFGAGRSRACAERRCGDRVHLHRPPSPEELV